MTIHSLRNIGLDKTLVVLANGPSLNRHHTPSLRVPRVHTLSINHPDPRAFPTTYWLYCDLNLHQRLRPLRETYDGQVIGSSNLLPHLDTRERRSHITIQRSPVPGFSRDLSNCVHIGRSTTYVALQLALWMNYDRVFILGCDMNPEDPSWHYGSVNPDVSADVRASRFQREADNFQFAATILSEQERARYYFSSDSNPWPFLDSFHRVPEAEAIPRILG